MEKTWSPHLQAMRDKMRQYRGCQGPFPDGRVEILQKCPEAHVEGRCAGLAGDCPAP